MIDREALPQGVGGDGDVLLASAIHLRGLLAERPDAGWWNRSFFYLATDTGALYQSTGVAWIAAGSGSTYSADETSVHLSGTTFSILTSWAGQTAITTVGTIATGVWAGTTIAVNRGGTSLATLTAHSLYVGNGTSAPTALGVANNGAVLIGSSGADPVWAFLGAGFGISTTPGAGALTISATMGSVIVLQDQQASGTNGGTFSNGAWRTRILNTEVVDTNSDCSLSSNQFTLTAGTYEILASVPAFCVDNNSTRLQNVTDGTTIMSGSTEYSASAGFYATCRSIIMGRFTIAASKAIEVQHRCVTSQSGFGFGAASSGYTVATEIYTTVWLRRVA